MKAFILVTISLVFVTSIIACAAPGAPAPTTAPKISSPTVPPPTAVVATLPPPTNLPVPTKLAPPTPAPQSLLGKTTTYSDVVAAFALDYPAAWNISPIADTAKKDSIIYSVTIYSFPPRTSGEGIPAGGTKMDIGVNKNGAKSPQDALAMRKQEIANGDLDQKILSEEPLTLARGLQATRLHISDRFGESYEIITALNGNTILLGGVGDSALIDAIAETLHPL